MAWLDKDVIEDRLQWSLESVHLWEELKDRLELNALVFRREQQQRLCIGPSDRHRARDLAHGRALLGSRPYCHSEDRRPDA